MRFEDGIAELDAGEFGRSDAEAFAFVLEDVPGFQFGADPVRCGHLLECVESPGDYFTGEEVAACLGVTAETVRAAMELRGGEIEGLHFRVVRLNRIGNKMGPRGPRRKIPDVRLR